MKRMCAAWTLILVVLLLLALLPSLVARADFGTNWSATFFPNPDLSGTGVPVSGINGLNFLWQAGPPIVNGVPVPISNCPSSPTCTDNFSARFTSSQAIQPGTYQFVVASDDGVRVYINGALRLDKFFGRPVTTDTFIETITSSPVQIVVEYFEGIDQATLQVQWFLQGTVTGTPFITATPLATTVPLTAVVEGVDGLALRSGPYLGASLVAVLRPGNTYTPVARNRDEGVYTWYQITTADGRSGWASGRYLKTTGNVDALPLVSTVFEQIDGAADTGVLAIPRSVMNLRRRPSQRTALLAQIPWGAELQLLGRTIQGGKNFWFQVRYEGQVGWIYAPFVSTRGDINSVPIH